jgi:hypothetical protein
MVQREFDSIRAVAFLIHEIVIVIVLILPLHVLVGLFEQPAEIRVLTSCRFEIEHEVFHAQSEVVQRFLKL